MEISTELVLRFEYGSAVPWLQRQDDAWLAVVGPHAVRIDSSIDLEGKDFTSVGSTTVSAGSACRSLSPGSPLTRGPPEPVDADAALEETERFWREWSGRCGYSGEWDEPVRTSLRVLKGVDLRPDGRNRRGADHLAAGGDRRRPQLGLPLLLAPRRHPHARRADRLGLPRRGPGVARVAVPRRRRPTRRTSRSCTASPVSVASRSTRPTGSRATRARRRSGWATQPPSRCSWTSTARSSTPSRPRGSTGSRPPTTPGGSRVNLLEFVEEAWRRPGCRASGRCAGRTGTSRTRR